MGKINKVYPSFYNGVSEQPPELMLDTNCKSMVNCIPSLVNNLRKRPPAIFTQEKSVFNETEHVFHTYDRGENNEEYIFVKTNNLSNPIEIYSKDGTQMTVQYNAEDESILKEYLHEGTLRGLTVQDRTWLFNTEKVVETSTEGQEEPSPYYDRTAYYWIKRGSGDKYNPYNYAVYINGETIALNPDKPSTSVSDPDTGAEDSDIAASLLTEVINSVAGVDIPDYIRAVHIGSIIKIYLAKIHTPLFRQGSTSYNHVWVKNNTTLEEELVSVFDYKTSFDLIHGNSSLYCTYNSTTDYHDLLTIADTIGTNYDIIVPYYPDTATSPTDISPEPETVTMTIHFEDITQLDFTFNSWDSWGNQASEGWKGSVSKLTDLPKGMPFDDVYVEIKGDDNDSFTNYYVRWNGSTWEETRAPKEVRGLLTNMPIACDRVSLVGNLATFELALLDWQEPTVGNTENNPDPSFVGYTISDVFFYRNRLGIASTDSVVLTESANYENFYIKTALEVVDTDPIDVSIASNQASKIYYTKPFNNSLYIFTKYAQYELRHEGYLSPETVTIDNVTNYPMAVDVEPKVVNNSLFFVSVTNNKQQLREYIKTDKLTVEGIDLNITTPNYIAEPITNILVNGVLGMVFCCTATNTIYMYNYKDNGQQRVQSSWSKWTLLEGLPTIQGSFEYSLLDATLLIICKTQTNYLYHTLQLDDLTEDNKVDITMNGVELPYMSSIQLPDYYPHLDKIGTPKNKILLKKVTIQGNGFFNASVYRKDYNRTYTKSSTGGLRDLDFHIASKVGNVDITVYDDSENDFDISSVTMEGLFSPTSKQVR